MGEICWAQVTEQGHSSAQVSLKQMCLPLKQLHKQKYISISKLQ
jgi:hypothetical protein